MTFEPEAPVAAPPAPLPPSDDGEYERKTIFLLEGELVSARAELQAAVEQLESVNEEMKASNEEATSMNEELQSTIEELETSKEELQSFNEELHSVNSQLHYKLNELDDTSNDLANLLSGTDVATLFLDTGMRVKWFSPATRPLLDLVASDIGRPFRHFARKFDDETLLPDAEAVLEKLVPMEAEVRGDDGRWFVRRVLPYRTRDNRIAGLVITFMDVTERRRATQDTNEARIYAEAIVETGRQSSVVLDAHARVRSANQAFYKLSGLTPDLVVGRRFHEIGAGEWDIPELRGLLEEVLPEDRRIEDLEVALGPGRRRILLNARKLARDGGRDDLVLLAIEDVTERSNAAAHQEMLIGELNHRVKNVLATVMALSAQTLRRSESLEGFGETFGGRLQALAKAHNLLVEEAWVGADVGQIVRDTLEPYRADGEDRVAAGGPSLSVRPQVGVALMMVLHELATNAVKYGSLSSPAGRLSVTWERRGDGAAQLFHVLWVESGGPLVRPPTRQGFGTRLIERSTAHELGGEARLDFAEAGVRCELIFPWAGRPEASAGVG